MVSRALLILCLAVLAACATQPPAPTEVPGKDEAPATPARPPEPVPDKGANSASAALLDEARRLRLHGELARADAVLQRAQRIDPRNGAVYLALAELLYTRGDVASAQTMAERGLLYCQPEDCRRLKQLTER